MRHQKQKTRLNRSKSHRTSLLRSLAKSLILHEKIKTTQAKAVYVRPYIERIISKAKTDTLHHRRCVIQRLGNHHAATMKKLFQEFGPRFQNRNGGYTRITKMGPRLGDRAPMVLIEILPK